MSRITQPQNVSCVYAYQTAPAQNIPINIVTLMKTDAKLFDVLDEFDLTNSRFTPKRAGYYYIDFRPYWAIPPAANNVSAMVYRNGVGPAIIQDNRHSAVGLNIRNIASGIVHLTPADYIGFYVYQNIVNPLALNAVTPSSTYLCIHRLS